MKASKMLQDDSRKPDRSDEQKLLPFKKRARLYSSSDYSEKTSQSGNPHTNSDDLKKIPSLLTTRQSAGDLSIVVSVEDASRVGGGGKEVDGVLMEHDGGGSKDGTSGGVVGDGKEVDGVLMEHDGGGGSKDGTSRGVVGDGKEVDRVLMEHDGGGGSKDGTSGGVVGDGKEVDGVLMEHDGGGGADSDGKHANQEKDEGGTSGAVDDVKQENKTKEMMEDDGGGSGHDCSSSALDVVDEGKQVQRVDTVMTVEGSKSHFNIDTTFEFKNISGEQVAAMLDADGDDNTRNSEPAGKQAAIEGVSTIVIDGGEQGKQAAIEDNGDGSTAVVTTNVIEDQDQKGKNPIECIVSGTVHGEIKEPESSNNAPIFGGVEEQLNQADPLTSPECILSLVIRHEGSVGSSEPSMQQANHAFGVSSTNIPSEEEHEVPVIHRPLRMIRLFGVDIVVPETEVQPPAPAAQIANQALSNGHGSSTQRPKRGFRLMGFDF
ncbi:hypothetical protein QVD17_04205 [Tagetes erecta]|uniref:Uncharacterized protein n=1 Tax=Tagetes erecta TaxID=13708 RepID=A0AAD8LFV6_TARER|nr:hypothetical protein QVD17_04205 [Tagetes erecta]